MSKFKFFDENNSTLEINGPAKVGNEFPQNDNILNKQTFAARYRCEQFNTTKVEDHINFHCDVKKQYLLETNLDKASVLLEQYVFKINPEDLGGAIQATEELEFDKENVTFSLNTDNTIKGIDNWQQIKQKWDFFKPKMRETSFYKMIGQNNPEAAEGLIAGGDMEFGSEQNLLKSFEKSLFYHVVFNDYDPVKDRTEKQILKFNSQIFVNISVELELTHGIINEDNEFTEIMTVGRLKKDKLDNNLLIEQYNNFYKPIIDYNFTEYNYEYVIKRTVHNKSKLIHHATARFMEEVKYNYQFLTQFDLKRIDE